MACKQKRLNYNLLSSAMFGVSYNLKARVKKEKVDVHPPPQKTLSGIIKTKLFEWVNFESGLILCLIGVLSSLK